MEANADMPLPTSLGMDCPYSLEGSF
jgi:hypothetical protein